MSTLSPVRGRRDAPAPVLFSDPTPGFWGRLPLGGKILSITLLFVAVLTGLQVFTYFSLQQLTLDARVVDVAARQRVLAERYIKETIVISQGGIADRKKTQDAFERTADELTNGASNAIINVDTGETGRIPRVTLDEARDQLAQQKTSMGQLVADADTFLKVKPGTPEYKLGLANILRDGDDLQKQANATTKLLSKNSTDTLREAIARQQILAFVVGMIGIISSLLIARQVTQPLSLVVSRAQEIGEGDLRGRPLPVVTTDEIGRLSSAFNVMQEGLRTVAAQAQEAAESLSAAAAEILATAQEQAAGSGEQAAAVQQTTTTMEEISRSGSQITDKARQVASSAEATSAASEAGLGAMQGATRSMDTIQQQAQTVAENVVALSEKTRAIGEIITTVNEIAEQSHLLALNAAIEAAGAGEQGRRFSVVADEMKHLADQSRDATVQVRSILSDIQRQIHTTVMVTEESVKRIEDGKRQSDTAEATIRRMAASIIDSVNAFQQIVAAANQQQIGFEQVTQAAQQIRAAVDQATVGTAQMETAAVNVNTLSQQLRNTVEAYRL